MSFSLKTHVTRRSRSGSGEAVTTRVRPYVRLAVQGKETVYIQEGRFYSEGGTEFTDDNLPDWIDDEVAKMTVAARQEVGLLGDDIGSNKKSV